MFRCLVESLAHPVGEFLSGLLCGFLPSGALGVSASERVLLHELFFLGLVVPTRSGPRSTPGRHQINHCYLEYTRKYFTCNAIFILIFALHPCSIWVGRT